MSHFIEGQDRSQVTLLPAVFRDGLSRHRAAHTQVSVDLDEALAERVSRLR
jgi:metal-dependent HD superfamily phosphatase/phosphodiesterase